MVQKFNFWALFQSEQLSGWIFKTGRGPKQAVEGRPPRECPIGFFKKKITVGSVLHFFHRERRERLAALAAETIDLAKDPYFMRYAISLFNIMISSICQGPLLYEVPLFHEIL